MPCKASIYWLSSPSPLHIPVALMGRLTGWCRAYSLISLRLKGSQAEREHSQDWGWSLGEGEGEGGMVAHTCHPSGWKVEVVGSEAQAYQLSQ